MKKITLLSTILLLGFSWNSCTQKEKKTSTPKPSDEKAQEQEIDDETSFLNQYPNAKKMQEIEERIDPDRRVESLYWEKQTEHGSELTQVVAHLNDDGFPMKITEYFAEGNFQPQGERHFYLENSKLIGYKENSDHWIDSNITNYVEKRTIYKKESPVVTQMRSAETYDEIENKKWKNTQQEHQSIEKVNKILAGTGEFEPHFISVIKSDQLFLLLGEAKPQTEERYTTAVRVDKMTPFIEDLLKNLEEYKFRPVDINFKIVGGNNSPQYRVLTSIEWKETKD